MRWTSSPHIGPQQGGVGTRGRQEDAAIWCKGKAAEAEADGAREGSASRRSAFDALVAGVKGQQRVAEAMQARAC